MTDISVALFCKVVDNYGDIGICWRLARQLHAEHGVRMALWVDDLASFQRLCPEVNCAAAIQQIDSITIRHWRDQQEQFTASDIADVVIEFFGCDIPPAYIEAMAQCDPRPVWLNLEGLSAEEWVEGCHTLPSPHPRLALTKYFFYPGFNARTGGLLHEAGLAQQRRAFQDDPAAVRGFLREIGLSELEAAASKVTLFCYPHAPVDDLFAVWQGAPEPLVCLVPEGVAQTPVAAFLGQPASAGKVVTRGALTVRVLPFLPQPDYDRLLWSADFNFVRGEDSFVRAQWAARPFIWHIYPQEQNLHHKKLRAFLQIDRAAPSGVQAFSLAWNGAEEQAASASGLDWASLWRAAHSDLAAVQSRAEAWQNDMLAQGDFGSNLMAFVLRLRLESRHFKV